MTDRYKLEAELLAGTKPQAIADKLHAHVSTIYREKNRARMIHRNSDWTEEERYNPDEAHRKYRENLSKKGAPLKIGNDRELADYLEKKVLEDSYSPAAALASIKLEGKTFSTSICVSTFHSYITKGVFRFLTNVEERGTVGDWEMDTVYSSKEGEKDTLLVLTERKSRLPITELMPDRTRGSVIAALDRIEHRFGARRVRQIFRRNSS